MLFVSKADIPYFFTVLYLMNNVFFQRDIGKIRTASYHMLQQSCTLETASHSWNAGHFAVL